MAESDAQLAAGAAAVVTLLRDIEAATLSHYAAYDDLPFDSYGDVRDYREFAALIEATLVQNYCEATGARREGFVRAMASLLARVADYNAPSLEGWDPLAETRGAYEMPRAENVLQRIASADVRNVGPAQ